MPIPWPAHFVPSAVGISLVVALCGALVGAFVACTLAPARVVPIGSRRCLPGAIGLAGFAAAMAFCLPTHAPASALATVTLDRVPGAGVTTAGATVAFNPASVVSDPDYVQQLSWQGHTRSVARVMRRVAPGVYRTVTPLALSGTWKSVIGVQQGPTRADVPVYLPADPAIPAALIPAEHRVTRALATESTLMQRERKRDVAGWLWSTATTAVLVIIAVLLAIIGWGLNRVAGRIAQDPPPRAQQRAAAATTPAAGGGGRGGGSGPMTVLACASHLLVDLPLFGGPVSCSRGARSGTGSWRPAPARGRAAPAARGPAAAGARRG